MRIKSFHIHCKTLITRGCEAWGVGSPWALMLETSLLCSIALEAAVAGAWLLEAHFSISGGDSYKLSETSSHSLRSHIVIGSPCLFRLCFLKSVLSSCLSLVLGDLVHQGQCLL